MPYPESGTLAIPDTNTPPHRVNKMPIRDAKIILYDSFGRTMAAGQGLSTGTSLSTLKIASDTHLFYFFEWTGCQER
jgi:hypothetical protein